MAAVCRRGVVKCEIFTSDRVQRVKMRHRAKFRGGRSKIWRSNCF